MASIASTDVASAQRDCAGYRFGSHVADRNSDACGGGDRPRRRPVCHQRAVRLSHRDHRVFCGDRRVQPASDHPHRARLAVPLRVRRCRCLCVGECRGNARISIPRRARRRNARVGRARAADRADHPAPDRQVFRADHILARRNPAHGLRGLAVGDRRRQWLQRHSGPGTRVRQPEVFLSARAGGGGLLHRGVRPHPVVRDRTLRQCDPRIRARWPNVSACR